MLEIIVMCSFVIHDHHVAHVRFSRNQLSSLPASVCELPLLRVLNVSNNKLSVLPGSIRRLAHLRQLVGTTCATVSAFSCSLYTHHPVLILLHYADSLAQLYVLVPAQNRLIGAILSYIICNSSSNFKSRLILLL